MKIGIVSEFYYPLWGGISEHIRAVAAELRTMGHDVVVITSRSRGAYEEDGTRVIRLGRSLPIRYNNSLSRLSVGWRLEAQMRGVLDAERFDLLHLHSPLQPTLTLLALHCARCPVVATFHSYYPRDLLAELFQRPLRRLLARARIRVPVSPAARRAAERLFPGDYRIVPNGVDYDLFAVRARERLLPPPDRNKRRRRILFVGAMVKRKGLPQLIEAFRMLCAERDDVELIVVGDGLGRRAIQRRITGALRERVQLVGPVTDRARLAEHYASADVFCAPSLGRESFGMVLLEAMAAGTPVVAYDIEGYRDVVSHGREGLLVKRGDTRALRDALAYFLDHPVERARYGELGRRKAQAHSWREIAARLERLYREAAGLPVEAAEPEEAGMAVGAGSL
jgi:phosphatidylinositol alpha-mannosyltransferase